MAFRVFFLLGLALSCFSSIDKPHIYDSDGFGIAMGKVRKAWKRAQGQIDDPKLLEKLYEDLLVYNKLEKKLKKAQSTGEDPDQRVQREVEDEAAILLKKYGIRIGEEMEEEDDPREVDRMFQDESVLNIWKIAVKSQFDEEELELLKSDLGDYDRQKMEHKEALKALADLHPEKANMVEEDLGEVNSLREKVKRTHHLLEDRQEQFESRAKLGSVKNAEFFADKLQALWTAAEKMELAEDERESLHDYLKHFEEKLKEHEHLKGKLDHHSERKSRAKIQMKRMSDRKEGEEKFVESEIKQVEVQENYKHSFKYLKKLYNHLTKRVGHKDEL